MLGLAAAEAPAFPSSWILAPELLTDYCLPPTYRGSPCPCFSRMTTL